MADYVRGVGHTVSGAFTRPANTTAYATGQVVSTVAGAMIKFVAATKEEGGQAILQEVLIVDTASAATKPDLQLWLFDTPIAAVADGAAFSPSNAELLTLVAVVPLPTGSFVGGGAANSVCDVQNLGIPFNTLKGDGKLVTADNALYGVLVVRNAYVPVSAETFTIRLKILD